MGSRVIVKIYTLLHTMAMLSLSRIRKGPRIKIDIEKVRDRERKIAWSVYKGTETFSSR